MGELIVNKVTYNSIFVTWKNLRCHAGSGILNSPSFSLTTDGYPLSFYLSLSCGRNSILKVGKNGSEIGRGIVFLGITEEIWKTPGITTEMCLNEAWEQSCSFNDIINLSHKLFHLKINCKITWLGFINDIPSPEHPPSLLSIENIPFDNTVFPDFIIIVDGQEIPSHKAILARWSPVLLAMFETPMKESEENKVTIEDIEYSTMMTLLRIFYTGNTADLNEIDTALKVFHAAVKYEMSTIKILCEYKLQQKIQMDNVLMLLAEADKYNATLLCETCVTYIFAAKNDELTKEFKEISQKPNIGLAVMNVFMDQLFFKPSERDEVGMLIISSTAKSYPDI